MAACTPCRSMAETPPQAWGRRQGDRIGGHHGGNTPTGVGKTGEVSDQSADAQKHPHRRGEDGRERGMTTQNAETPPQAWGRRADRRSPRNGLRNTPTGVGKTAGHFYARRNHGKHPHRRGEDVMALVTHPATAETPPQAWGRHDRMNAIHSLFGNTPTGVGKTTRRNVLARRAWKHPHRRGEDGLPDLAT